MAESVELSGIDRHFGALISRLSGMRDPEIFLGAALASLATREGHACLDLSRWSGREVATAEGEIYRCPELALWIEALAGCPAVGDGTEVTPLVLEDGRLYLHRYWEYENDVARFVAERSRRPNVAIDEIGLGEIVGRLFPDSSEGCDWQRLAALAAALRTFVVVTGGPGTGKTTTVAAIIALLLEQAGGDGSFSVALAAPTGKAVMRLQQVMTAIKARLACDETVRGRIPTIVLTLHRLLGSRKSSPFFIHDEGNPLPHDLIVVDEASMVDLPLMAKLIRAIRPETGLILLGDRNQLASVEPGAVLGDLCHVANPAKFSDEFLRLAASVADLKGLIPGGGGRDDSLVELRCSRRFGGESGVGLAGRAVNRGDYEELARIFLDQKYGDVEWLDIGSESRLRRELFDKFGYSPPAWFGIDEPVEALRALTKKQVLCAVRHGGFGVNKVNFHIERVLAESLGVEPGAAAYPGRPVLITENNYEVQLFNGDTGLIMAGPGKKGLRAYFPDGAGGVREVPLAMLPAHETAYAMTVHKSQGSEFDEVTVILPDRHYPVMTRELLYTALTRARKRVEVWSGSEVLRSTVFAVIGRQGGLRDKLVSDEG